MPTSYTSLIGLALPVTGELSGTWGDVVNNYITNYLDSAVAGTQTISGTQTAVTLSVTNGSSLVTAGSGATGSAQFQIINCTGNPAGLLTITAPASSRQYIIINATSTSQSVKIVGTGPTTGVTLIAGEKAHVAWNGSDFVKIATTAAAGGSNTQVQYNSSGVLAGSSNMTFDGTNLTVGGTASATKLIPTGGAATGNGMYLPAANTLAWSNNGSETMRLNSSGNLGLGATPSAWSSGSAAFEFGSTNPAYIGFNSTGASGGYIYSNAYYNGTNNIYKFTGVANAFGVGPSGGFQFFTAASGTAGNTISFTQAMTLDANGNLGVGITAPSTSTSNARGLVVGGGAEGQIRVQTTNTGTTSSDGLLLSLDSSANAIAYIWNYENASMLFGTNNTERMRIDASGNLGLGVTPSAWGTSGTVLKAINLAGTPNFVAGGSGFNGFFAGSNAYFDGTNWKYVNTNGAAYYNIASGSHAWYTAGSGTAGTTISFTQAMTLDSSGNLLIGLTSGGSYKLDVSGSANQVGRFTTSATGSYGALHIVNTGTNAEASIGFRDFSDSDATSWVIGKSVGATDAFGFYYGGTKMLLDTSGNLGIGTTSPQAYSGYTVATVDNATNGGVVSVRKNGTVYLNLYTETSLGVIEGVGTGTGLKFLANNSERARITSGGYFKASNDGTYISSTGSYHEFRQTASAPGAYVNATNASYADAAFVSRVTRAATSAYIFLYCESSGGSDAEFNLRGDGNAYADGTWNNNGADYAEYFESATGGALTVGATVVLDGNKVREATDQDPVSAIMGVVRPKEPSKASMVVGNTAWNKWANKYLTDDFDRYIMEDHDVVEWIDEEGKQHSYESHKIPTGVTVPVDAVVKTHDDKGKKFQHYKLNPAWNPDAEYVNRENRPEWIIVGLVGQVKVLKGQPVNDRWIKMRDVSATVEEWMIR